MQLLYGIITLKLFYLIAMIHAQETGAIKNRLHFLAPAFRTTMRLR